MSKWDFTIKLTDDNRDDMVIIIKYYAVMNGKLLCKGIKP